MNINTAIMQIGEDVYAQYAADHPAAVAGLKAAVAFHDAVTGMLINKAMEDAELASLIHDGRQIERDTYAWTRLVELAGQVIPQLITKFAGA